MGRILDFFAEESGKMFDPSLVAILLGNAARFQEIAARFPDEVLDAKR